MRAKISWMTKFSISGLRGVVGSDLTTLDFASVSNAFCRFMKAEKMLLARDARITGEMIHCAAVAGIMSAGCQLTDAGMVTTPTAVFAVLKSGANAGIVITASHNPQDQNGLKFLESGRFLAPHTSSQLVKYVGVAKFVQVDAQLIKPLEKFDAQSVHRDALLSLFPSNSLEPRLKIGLDPVNGAAGPEALEILKALNCEVHTINFTPNGRFARGGEPVPENLDNLQSLVKEKNLDIGFAFDPDGDRLAFIDETGCPPGEEYTIPLCTKWGVENKKGDIVVNMSTSRLIESIAKDAGVAVHRTPVGEAHVVERLLKIDGSCGGEGNGGFIFPEFNATRDGLLAMAVLVALKRKHRRLSDIVNSLPTYHRFKEKLNIPFTSNLVEKVASLYPSGNCDYQDGLWIGEQDFWLHLRPSNTEPIVRLLIEASSKELGEQISKQVKTICVE